jgi:hypothetical protein
VTAAQAGTARQNQDPFKENRESDRSHTITCTVGRLHYRGSQNPKGTLMPTTQEQATTLTLGTIMINEVDDSH